MDCGAGRMTRQAVLQVGLQAAGDNVLCMQLYLTTSPIQHQPCMLRSCISSRRGCSDASSTSSSNVKSGSGSRISCLTMCFAHHSIQNASMNCGGESCSSPYVRDPCGKQHTLCTHGCLGAATCWAWPATIWHSVRVACMALCCHDHIAARASLHVGLRGTGPGQGWVPLQWAAGQ